MRSHAAQTASQRSRDISSRRFDPDGARFNQLAADETDIAKREALASHVIGYYMAGIKDENELISLSKQPLGR
jgi:hypothetical protein